MSNLQDILYTEFVTSVLKIGKVRYDLDPDVILAYDLEKYYIENISAIDLVELIVGDILY